MKTLKFLVTSLFVLCFFFVSTDINGHEKWGKSGKEEWKDVTFFCPPSGEMLRGTIVYCLNEKGKVTHVTFKGRKLIGYKIGGFDDNGAPYAGDEPSGNVYMFTRVDNFDHDKGVIIIRTVRLGDGIVTRFTVHL